MTKYNCLMDELILETLTKLELVTFPGNKQDSTCSSHKIILLNNLAVNLFYGAKSRHISVQF